MKGITIRDHDPGSDVLSFDLRDILALLGSDVALSTWLVNDLECLGSAADALHEASDTGRPLAGTFLQALAQDIYQVIDGEFSAWLPNESTPWLVLRAVDSTEWDVVTNRADVLATIRAHFKDVTDLPDAALVLDGSRRSPP